MRVLPAIAALAFSLGPLPADPPVSAITEANTLQEAAGAEAPLVIPVSLRNHLPTATVWVNGQPQELFLDLAGSAALALTPHELSSTSVDYLSTGTSVRDAMGYITQGRRFLAQSVRVGATEIGPLVGEEWHIGAYGPPDRNGYLGMGLFANRLAVFDYSQGSVRLYSGQNPRRLREECGDSAILAIRVENGIAVSLVHTNVGPLRVLWYSGSTDNVVRSTLLTDNNLKSVPVEDGPPVFSFREFTGLGATVPSPEFRDVPFQAPDVDLVLGTPFFLQNKVCLDLAAGQAAVKSF